MKKTLLIILILGLGLLLGYACSKKSSSNSNPVSPNNPNNPPTGSYSITYQISTSNYKSGPYITSLESTNIVLAGITFYDRIIFLNASVLSFSVTSSNTTVNFPWSSTSQTFSSYYPAFLGLVMEASILKSQALLTNTMFNLSISKNGIVVKSTNWRGSAGIYITNY